MGLSINAFVRMRLSRHSTDVLERFSFAIIEMDEVMELYLMADFDYVLRVMMHDNDDLQQLVTAHLSRIGGVSQVKTTLFCASSAPR